MYVPDISSVFDRRSMAPDTLSLDKSHFTLDTSGVAGVFGGDEAVSAMATVHVYESRRWLGWYNSPGSYQIARRFGVLAGSRFFEGFFPGASTDPATLFGFDGWKGPRFRAAHSGTIIEETGHLASLFVKKCTTLPVTEQDVEGARRATRRVGVTIARLNHVPEPRQMFPRRINTCSPFFASIPISVSVASCIACGVFGDWYSFSLILLGILTSGISCLVIGSGVLMFIHPEPAEGSPPGDGILGSDNQVVLLQGAEGAVNSITRGIFSLEFSSKPEYKDIGWCSVLLTIQFIAQLLLVPQGSLFGQIMFVTSLGVSWIYNLSLSSPKEMEKIQWDMLSNDVLQNPVLTKYNLGTRTTMVVFVLLVLQPEEPRKILDELLPNDTKVWKKWKETIVQRLLDNLKEKFEFVNADWELDGFTQRECSLLKTLYGDAQVAYGGYRKYHDVASK